MAILEFYCSNCKEGYARIVYTQQSPKTCPRCGEQGELQVSLPAHTEVK